MYFIKLFLCLSVACLAHSQSCPDVNVRLSNMSYGRVEVCYNGEWGSVCDDSWDLTDGGVVCKQLGYSRALAVFHSSYYGMGTGPILMDNVQCSGDEDRLDDCSFKGWGINDCTHHDDAGVMCKVIDSSNPSVLDGRIFNTSASHSTGTVQLYYNSKWLPVCDVGWGKQEGAVFCKQLSFPSFVNTFPSNAVVNSEDQHHAISGITCSGVENSIADCDISNINIISNADCTNQAIICSELTSPTVTIRLVDGLSQWDGRVELLNDKSWSLICGDDWTLINADVACHQLGFQSGVRNSSITPEGDGALEDAVWLVGVACTGGEGSLVDCPHSTTGTSSCTSYASVICTDVQNALSVRLVGGSNANEGRVEVLYGDSWGTVCDDGWDLSDANVVCHQLGYTRAQQALVTLPSQQHPRFGEGSGEIWMDEIDCVGDESKLADCSFAGWSKHNCYHTEDAGVVCTNSLMPEPPVLGLRLVNNGSDVFSGRVEVSYNGVWGTVCDDGWDINDANVVCQELILGNALSAYGGAQFGEGSGPIWLDEVSCSPGSISLSSCGTTNGLNTSDCTHAEDAGVSCEGPECSIRLSDGNYLWEGTVYIRIKGEWRGVCDDGFDLIDARVACRQAGYSDAVLYNGLINVMSEDYWLENLACVGTEEKLCQCPSNGIGQESCQAYEGVKVTCLFADPFEARLAGGHAPWEGRIEIRVNDVWGRACNDWQDDNLNTLCRHLGYTKAVEVEYLNADYGTGSGPFWFKDVECSESDNDIFECPRATNSLQDTGCNSDAVVLCDPGNRFPSLMNHPIRLVDGSTPYEGRLEILYKGVWGTVCGGGVNTEWSYTESHVVCRQMGFGPALTERIQGFPPGKGLILLDDVQCIGSEDYLTDCINEDEDWGVHNCYHSNDVAINCSILSFDPLPVKLSNGLSVDQGVVVVSYGGLNGAVCGGNQWNLMNARVVCRELGFADAISTEATLKSESDLEWFWIGDVKCHGNESRLLDCPSSGLGNANCTSPPAMVTCGDYPEGSIRLTGGETSSEGVLEVFYGGRWGSVCRNGWGARSAEIACKQLGFYRPVRTVTHVSQYEYSGLDGSPVWLDQVQCNGDEESLLDCPHGPLGTHLCSHYHDIGLICSDEPYYPIQLVSTGIKQNEGCVQFFHTNTWGSVCHQPSSTVSNVLCRTLGFPSGSSSSSCSGYPSSTDYSLPVWLSTISCSGSESSIANCSLVSYGQHMCEGHTQDLAIACKGDSHPVRLYGGRNSSEGRIEVFHNSQWGVICSDFFDNNDAAVICRQLGFSGVEEIVDVTVFGGGGTVLIDDLSCNGDETNLVDCGNIQWGSHNCYTPKDVGLICTIWSPNRVGTVRLIGGPDSSSGRLEVFQGSFWGSVCNNNWRLNESNVVCRELGYTQAILTTDYRSFGTGGGVIKLGSVSCNGDEVLFNECVNSTDTSDCTHMNDVGIVCQKPVSDRCTDGNVRLTGGPDEFAGLLEICIEGHWGTICNDDTLNVTAVDVACRSLGHASSGGSMLSGTVYGRGTGIIWLSGVECDGSESSLNDCSHLEYGHFSATCYGHSQDVNIQCRAISSFMIRLSKGSHGRVEVFYNGKWGSVCDTQWDQQDADVVCVELGYARAMRPSTGSEYGPSWGPIWMGGVSCSGRETSLQYCGHSGWGITTCSHENEAGAVCTDSPIQTNPSAQIRLVGATPLEGRVEVLYDGKWGTICYNGWDFLDAQVICRQAGYSSVSSIRVSTPNDGSVSDSFPIWLSQVDCTGDESNIALCDSRGWGSHDCSHDQDAAVVCSNEDQSSAPIGIRLMDGDTPGDGRVQIRFNGIWGRVCDQYWDIRDGNVVCKELGYTGARLVKVFTTPTSNPPAYVWMDSVHCVGVERNISYCSFSGWGHGRDNDCNDAGVVCEMFGGDSVQGNYQVRLRDGPTHSEGRVEVFYSGLWGTICDTQWSLNHANVVCRQLGYRGAVKAYVGSWYGAGSGVVLMDGIDCNGAESRLVDCSFRGWGYVNAHCTAHTRDASVVCEDTDVPSVSIQLLGGSNSKGIVQVYHSGRWGLVCEHNWGDFDAQVVCNQLGDVSESPRAVLYSVDLSQYLIWLDNVQCNGSEDSISKCAHNGWAVHQCKDGDKVAGVDCLYKNPPQFSARLIGGNGSYEGRLQVFYNSEWGSVCNHGWSFNDARVVCRQLGFGDASKSITTESIYGNAEDEELFIIDNVQCRGNEPGIQYCDSSGFGIYDCSVSEVVGVICSDTRHPPVVSVRLNPSSNATRGLVQVLYNDTWGSVCMDGWDSADSSVVCRQLGYESVVSTFRGSEESWSVDGIVWIARVACDGTETSIGDCFMENQWGVNNCNHNDDVAVECSSVKTALYPLRLVSGPSISSGRVQVLVNGTWGRVCVGSNHESFSVNAGTVVCKQLGFRRILQVLYGDEYGEPLPAEPVWITKLLCSGTENDISDCQSLIVTSTDHTCVGGVSVICEVYSTGSQPKENSTRLVNDGIHMNKGRLEVFFNGDWGAVCDDFWSNEGAGVVCRQLGFAGPAKGLDEAAYGQSLLPYVMDDVVCEGDEKYLTDCSFMRPTLGKCAHNAEEAAVECSEVSLDLFEVKLAGSSRLSGLIEIFNGIQWGYVCGNQWTKTEASVVCRQLGLEGSGIMSSLDFELSTPISPLLGGIACDGNEHRLQDCYITDWTGGACPEGAEYAGVVCESVDNTVRLSEGVRGRVEVYMNGVWGTVCDNGWSISAGDVVCRELGYPRAESVYKGAWFGEGSSSSPVWLAGVECSGSEESILFCNYQAKGADVGCNHDQDVGIACAQELSVTTSLLCETGSVRLVDGITDRDGRVEVCLNNDWVRICQDEWDFRDATVICNQLGYPIEGAAGLTASSQSYRIRYNPILIGTVKCTGLENKILDCDHTPSLTCGNTQDAAVRCMKVLDVPQPLPIRLTGISNLLWAGNVEVDVYRNNKVWGSICGERWSLEDAIVVCKQLGFHSALGASTHPIFGLRSSSSPFVYTNVDCIGLENGVSNCVYDSASSTVCNPSRIAGAICVKEDEVPQMALRLIDGADESMGRLQVLFAGIWGEVCLSQWGQEEGLVACHQLGYKTMVESYGVSKPSGSVVWLNDGIRCTGTEANIAYCNYTGVGEQSCVTTVWLSCSGNTSNSVLYSVSPLSVIPIASATPPIDVSIENTERAGTSFDLLMALIIVGVVCGVFLVGMIGFCMAFFVYRWKWHSRTYKIPITPRAEREEMQNNEAAAAVQQERNASRRRAATRNPHGSVSSEMHLISPPMSPTSDQSDSDLRLHITDQYSTDSNFNTNDARYHSLPRSVNIESFQLSNPPLGHNRAAPLTRVISENSTRQVVKEGVEQSRV